MSERDEKIVSLLEEIRDLQKTNLEKNQELMTRSELRQKKYMRNVLLLIGAFLFIIILTTFSTLNG